MNNMLKVHKVILLCFAICLALLLSMVFFGYGPTERKVKTLKREVADLEQSIMGLRLPVERQALEARLVQANGRLEESQEKLDAVMARYAAMYRPMVESHNWTMEGFFQQRPRPSRDLFMSEYERIVMASPFGNLDESRSRLGFSRDSDSERRHLMLLQLWCVEKLLRTVKDAGLDLVFEEQSSTRASEEGTGTRRGHRSKGTAGRGDARGTVRLADLVVVPAVELSEDGEKKKARMIRMEYRIGVSGSMEGMMAFLDTLALPETFFGIRTFALKLLPPGKKAEPKAEGIMQLNLSLVSFIDLDSLGKSEDE